MVPLLVLAAIGSAAVVVTGANLMLRIVTIMPHQRALRLEPAKNVALGTAAVSAVVILIMIGVYNSKVQAESRQQSTSSTVLPEPEFDVASIKPSSFPEPSKKAGAELALTIARDSSHGRFRVPNATLHRLIQLAYNLKDNQIEGEPRWADSELYAVEAKSSSDLSFEQMRPMLRSLLAERFNLKVHESTKELPVYELTVAKGGLKIVQAKHGSCVMPDQTAPLPLGTKLCGDIETMYMTQSVRKREGFGVNMPKLVEMLSQQFGSIVVDRTGFSGTFDFELDYSEEDAAPIASSPPTSANGPDRQGLQTDSRAPSISRALQEQLGIKLISTKDQVEALVIDDVQKPSPN